MAGPPLRNRNAALKEGEQPRRGHNWNSSLPYEEWEAFKSAADLSEGYTLSGKEYDDLLRALCRGAISAFIKQHHGLVDPTIIV